MSSEETGPASRDLALVEAALFLSAQPLTRRGLASLLGDVQLGYVDQLLDELRSELDHSARAIELHVEEGRAMLRVRAEYVERVAHLAPQHDIPRPVLRSLAVIAYNHPMTQADLVRVRGNKAYGHVQELIERRLIRAEDQGKTQLLHVTPEFLRHFGLRSVEEFRFHVAGGPGETTPPVGDDSRSAPEDFTPRAGDAAELREDERIVPVSAGDVSQDE
jgi:segregation and condensation protein B